MIITSQKQYDEARREANELSKFLRNGYNPESYGYSESNYNHECRDKKARLNELRNALTKEDIRINKRFF